jgi:ABC-type dipeptide/oligopeptide/nickel transport system permease component
MDRTEWKKRGKWINILTVALSYKGRAIPLFWIGICLAPFYNHQITQISTRKRIILT